MYFFVWWFRLLHRMLTHDVLFDSAVLVKRWNMMQWREKVSRHLCIKLFLLYSEHVSIHVSNYFIDSFWLFSYPTCLRLHRCWWVFFFLWNPVSFNVEKRRLTRFIIQVNRNQIDFKTMVASWWINLNFCFSRCALNFEKLRRLILKNLFSRLSVLYF